MRLSNNFLCPFGIITSLCAVGQDFSEVKESPYTASTYERLHFGLRAGVNFSTGQFESSQEDLRSRWSVGWMAAGMATYRFNRHFVLRSDLGYSRRESWFRNDSANYDNRLKLDFAELALLAQRRFEAVIGDMHTDIYLGAGPTLSYLLGSSGTIEGPSASMDYGIVLNGLTDTSLHAVYAVGANRWLLGIDLGAGIMMPVAHTQRILLEVRASFGLTPLGNPGSDIQVNLPPYFSPDGSNFLQQRIQSVTFSASYVFAHNILKSKLGRSTKEKDVKKRDPRKQKKDKTYLDTRIKYRSKSKK